MAIKARKTDSTGFKGEYTNGPRILKGKDGKFHLVEADVAMDGSDARIRSHKASIKVLVNDRTKEGLWEKASKGLRDNLEKAFESEELEEA